MRQGAHIGAVADAAFFLREPACSMAMPVRCTGPAKRRSKRPFRKLSFGMIST